MLKNGRKKVFWEIHCVFWERFGLGVWTFIDLGLIIYFTNVLELPRES